MKQVLSKLSGKEHKGSTQVTIHKTAHIIEIVESNKKVKPELPYSITAHVKTLNGAPVKSNTEDPVNFAITYYRKNKQNTERLFEKVSLTNGAAKLSIDIPINVTEIEADIKYMKTTAKTQDLKICKMYIQFVFSTAQILAMIFQ